jgi:glycine cleavage system aminomethyltransferase T
VEPPPFFGRNEAELRACASNAVDMAEGAFDMTAMRLTVDGETVADLSVYRAATPRFALWVPEDNLLESDERVADSVADGYQVMLSPLSEGAHEVVISIPGPQTVTIAYRLAVDSGAAAAPGESGATPSSLAGEETAALGGDGPR